MITVVIDTNNLLIRSFFLHKTYAKTTEGISIKNYDTNEEVNSLIRKLAIDVSYILKEINPSKVIFTSDNKSWRKSILIEENDGYKANRVKDNTINWENIYNALDEFLDTVEKNGFISSNVYRAEADDLASMWGDYLLNKEKTHVVVVTSDEDIRQLITHTSDNYYLCVYNPFMQGIDKDYNRPMRKFYTDDSFKEWINSQDEIEIDIFNVGAEYNPDKSNFKRVLNNNYIKHVIVDGEEIALKKIFMGDKGDNIPPLHSWYTPTSTKIVNISTKKYEKIREDVIIKKVDDLLGDYTQELIKESIENISKQKLKINIQDRIKRQIQLVELKSKNFPIDIVDNFNKKEIIKYHKGKLLDCSSMDLEVMLKNSKFISDDFNKEKYHKDTTLADVFNDIDKSLKLKSESLF